MLAVSTLVLVLCSIFAAEANSGGAPAEACDTLTPKHDNYTPRTSGVPYAIDLSPFEGENGTYQYTPSKTYTLTLAGTGGEVFEGFFVQCRLMSDGTTRVGRFAAAAANSRLSSCPVDTDGVTHVNTGSPKIEFEEMKMDWTAPPEGTGTVQFAFSVVHEFDEFWADERSEMLDEGPSRGSGMALSVLGLLLALLVSLLHC